MLSLEKIRGELRTDTTIQRALRYSKHGIKALPHASIEYAVEKLPIVQWLPRYAPRWILNDILAGLTVGIMLVPQGLAYAKIATIPVEYGLVSSWLPAAIYVLMGTSKELSVGPTSILGLLTAAIVADMKDEGYRPEIVAAAVALMVGVYSFAMGILKLGFILDFISAPVLTGFISAASIVIMLGQIPSLFGIKIRGSGSADTIREVLTNLGNSNWRTVLIALSGIFLLQTLQVAGNKWGKKNKIIWALSIGRAAIVLTLFTGVSYGVNNNRPKELFDISKVTSKGVQHPALPDMNLVEKVATKSLAPFLAAALEHIAIGKAFGLKNGYVIDPSQEMVYLGITNFFNSFFNGMAVGGAMSRTAVSSNSGVKSPLNGIFTSGFVLLAIYKLTGALYWIPKATLAAIIVTAVYHLFGPLSVFYQFWRTSLADFIASMICFWVTIFVSAEEGILFAVAFSVAYTLVRAAFSSVKVVGIPAKTPSDGPDFAPVTLPPDTKVFQFEEALLFLNAQRAKDSILTTLRVQHQGLKDISGETVSKNDRSWSVAGEMRIKRLRALAGINADSLHPIRVVVLDFSRVVHLDTTGMVAMYQLREELGRFAGNDVEMRFIGMNDEVRNRFARFGGWELVDADAEKTVNEKETGVYTSVEEAVVALRRIGDNRTLVGSVDEKA